MGDRNVANLQESSLVFYVHNYSIIMHNYIIRNIDFCILHNNLNPYSEIWSYNEIEVQV